MADRHPKRGGRDRSTEIFPGLGQGPSDFHFWRRGRNVHLFFGDEADRNEGLLHVLPKVERVVRPAGPPRIKLEDIPLGSKLTGGKATGDYNRFALRIDRAKDRLKSIVGIVWKILSQEGPAFGGLLPRHFAKL